MKFAMGNAVEILKKEADHMLLIAVEIWIFKKKGWFK